MKSQKKFTALLLTSILLVSMTPFKIYAAEDRDAAWGISGKAFAETILKIEYGTETGKVYCNSYLNMGDGAGPEAFWVENENSIYILDSLNKRINHYINGVYSDSYTLPIVRAPQCFSIAPDGTIYVCEVYNGKVTLFIYYPNGFVDSFGLKLEDFVRNIGILPNGLIYATDWHEMQFYDNSNGTLEFVGSHILERSEMPENSYTKYIGADDACHYEMQTTLVTSSMLLGEINIVAIRKDGVTAGSARVPLEEFISRPNQYVQIGTNGIIYFMIPTEQYLEIRKVTLGTISDSQIDKVIAFAQEYAALAEERTSRAAAPSFTREQVFSRANLIATQTWTLSSDNIHTTSNIELPKYIQEIVDAGLLDNGGTVEMTGIPYCWGGFDSRYTSNTSGCSNFNEAIAADGTAGNVLTKGNEKINGTAGLDCSGFASAAYGFSYKWGTGDFMNHGKKVDKDTIQSMDFIVKKGHVVLFISWAAADKSKMGIMETALRDYTDAKTLSRTVDTDKFMGTVYEMRSPWK